LAIDSRDALFFVLFLMELAAPKVVPALPAANRFKLRYLRAGFTFHSLTHTRQVLIEKQTSWRLCAKIGAWSFRQFVRFISL
jgi:hypothetical protein